MTQEYEEYVESVAANTAEIVAATDVAIDAHLTVFPKQHWNSITQIGKEIQDGLISESLQASLAPFMQPPGEEIAETPEDEDDEKSAVPSLIKGMAEDGGVRQR